LCLRLGKRRPKAKANRDQSDEPEPVSAAMAESHGCSLVAGKRSCLSRETYLQSSRGVKDIVFWYINSMLHGLAAALAVHGGWRRGMSLTGQCGRGNLHDRRAYDFARGRTAAVSPYRKSTIYWRGRRHRWPQL